METLAHIHPPNLITPDERPQESAQRHDLAALGESLAHLGWQELLYDMDDPFGEDPTDRLRSMGII